MEAKTLVIRMTEQGRRILNLDLPAESVRWLSRLIPEQLASLLQRAGVCLAGLERRYHQGPLLQGSVLALVQPEHDREILLYLS